MELNDEEKKALKTLKEVASDDFDTLGDDISPKMAKNILNLIEKQQKEIEELNKNKQQINYNEIFSPDFVEENFISKDKIREIIEHYNNELEHIKNGEEFENEKPMYYWGKVALEELLEEK